MDKEIIVPPKPEPITTESYVVGITISSRITKFLLCYLDCQ